MRVLIGGVSDDNDNGSGVNSAGPRRETQRGSDRVCQHLIERVLY